MNLKQTLIPVALALALLGSAQAHDHHAAASAPDMAHASPLPPLAVRYALRHNATRSEWYLWRDADRIETADLATAQGNIWERSEREGYAYSRVFHRDRRVVEYTPGELRTRHAEPDWAKLASVISPQRLATLQRGATKQAFGQRSVHYSGQLDGRQIELWWLEQAQLPASLKIVGDGQRLELDLEEIHAWAPEAWPRASETRIADYARLDAADFGDMESDPFVARLLQQEGHTHAH